MHQRKSIAPLVYHLTVIVGMSWAVQFVHWINPFELHDFYDLLNQVQMYDMYDNKFVHLASYLKSKMTSSMELVLTL